MKPANKIIHGNCLEVLKTFDSSFVDLSITSPPYNKGEKHKGWLVKNVVYDACEDKKSEQDYQNEQIKILNEVFRVTKDGGSFFYNHKIRWEKGVIIHPLEWISKTDWTIRQEIIWDRMIAANIRGWRFWQVDEKIFWLYKPTQNNKIGKELASKHALLTSIWRFPPERKNVHPAPFPLALPTRIINSILEENEGTVLDPFCGSGTTLLAAKLLKKNFLGIEISKDYINLTEERLANCNNEKKTAEEELQKHTVLKTFKDRKQNGEFTGKFKKGLSPKQKNQINFLEKKTNP
ncbi:site-specific DNA-methyltransferase [bacterium]|nr:site-specific DNA-methyltransferase [bacterium]